MDLLRILVVEDNQDKLRQVLTCLQSVSGCRPDAIDTAVSSADAKRLLKAGRYDLMILDISLPDRAGDMPSPDGGIKLLEEVLEREMYMKPREVVGLTAFAEVLESAGRRFAEDLWVVIHYDHTTDYWSQQLQKKVRYILLAKRAASLPQYKTHLCVVTALLKPELSAILDLPWGWETFEVPHDPTVYHRGFFVKPGRVERLEVIAATASKVGLTSAAILSVKMVNLFLPRYLVVTGILAGIKGRSYAGDIIAADPSWDWGSGKFEGKNGVHTFAPAPYQLSLNSFVRSKLSLLSNDATALDEVRRGWRGPKPKTVLNMHIGPVASGASVLGDSEIAKAVLSQHRKLIGIEMETYSVLAAADESPLPQPKAFSLKSVSDFADAAKNDEHQEYASYTSAAALKIFVERYL